MARTALLSHVEDRLADALAGRLAADGTTVTGAPTGTLDVLVHAVDVPAPAPFLGADPVRWYAGVSNGLTPAFRAVRDHLPALRRSGQGRVVLLGAGWFPADRATSTAAAAVHGGLVALTKTLARDLGPEGIAVNQVVVDPGHPVDPAAVAATVAYLCRPDAGAVVGQLVTVGRGGPLRP